MPVIDNQYAFLFYLIAACLIIISLSAVVIYLVRKKVSLTITKDGFSMNAPNGKLYVESDYAFKVMQEVEGKRERQYEIKNHDTLEQQMRYLERETYSFYEVISNEFKTKSELEIELLEHHRYMALDYFKEEIVKKNHFASRTKWENYKRQIEGVSYISLKKLWDEKVKELMRDNIQVEALFDYHEVKEAYGKCFRIWMDEFKEIAKDSIDEIAKIESEISKLYLLLGHKAILGGNND